MSPAVAVILLLSACDSAQNDPSAESHVRGGAREDVPSALDDMRNEAFPPPLIDPEQVLSGGPPPDGIPALDRPRFTPVREVDWLAPREPVLSLTVGGETRAYPLQVMTWHEIVNDTVGGVPVAVTYCPLCNSGVAFHLRAAKRLLTFGTSGRLYADNLVMYDRQTESLWPQLTGVASIGVLTGTKLKAIPMGAIGWSDFKKAHPRALVLNRDTGFDRPYGTNPYVGYDDRDSEVLFNRPRPTDRRLPPKERVVGIEAGGEFVAIVRDSLPGREPLAIAVGGKELVVTHSPSQASALGARQIAEGEDIGSVVVEEASSRKPVVYLDTFWFSWVAFHPDTRLVSAPSAGAPRRSARPGPSHR